MIDHLSTNAIEFHVMKEFYWEVPAKTDKDCL
jgi:hypothetical protein